ncbi:MAG: twin-arginine translocase TatA/TatE family subunit [Anaerolineae bacterium]|jgi:sec-independent protein translocase protein TatA
MPFGKVGVWELLIVLLIVVAVFGAGKIASLGGALGKGVSDFRSAMGSDEKNKEPDDKKDSAAADAAEGAAAGTQNEAKSEDF